MFIDHTDKSSLTNCQFVPEGHFRDKNAENPGHVIHHTIIHGCQIVIESMPGRRERVCDEVDDTVHTWF